MKKAIYLQENETTLVEGNSNSCKTNKQKQLKSVFVFSGRLGISAQREQHAITLDRPRNENECW